MAILKVWREGNVALMIHFGKDEFAKKEKIRLFGELVDRFDNKKMVNNIDKKKRLVYNKK